MVWCFVLEHPWRGGGTNGVPRHEHSSGHCSCLAHTRPWVCSKASPHPPLFVLKRHWEEIFSYSKEPCLIICVAFLMNYKELLLLAKHVPDATPQAEFFGFFK